MANENNGTVPIEDDEITLHELLLILKKKSLIISSIFLITVFAAAIISFIITPVYRSSIVIKGPVTSYNITPQASVISTDESGKLINVLINAVEEKNTAELSSLLKISDNNAKQIVSFDTILPTDPLKNFIEIIIEVEDPSLIATIKDGIIRYLNENKYVNERITLIKTNLNRRKQEMHDKINEIVKFKNILTKQIKSGKVNNLGFNPMLMERDIINLRQELNDIEDKIHLLRGFEVVVEPFIPKNPAKPKKIQNMAVAGIISLFFGVLVAFFMEWLEKNKAYSN